MKKLYWTIITIIILILFWQLSAIYVGNQYVLPYPLDVGSALLHLMSDMQTYRIIGSSLLRLIIAVTFSSLSGILMGLVAGNNRPFDNLLNPVITSLRTLPVASIIVIILILFGRAYGLYIIAFLMLFPIMYEATKQGVLNINQNLKDALSLEHHHIIYKIVSIHLPLTFPYVKLAFLQSIGLGFKVLVMAEFIAQAPNSIGQALYRGSITIDYTMVFAWTLIIIAIVSMMETVIKKIRAYV